MSDIKIPLRGSEKAGEYAACITITKEIARQIVALSAVPAFEANTLARLASIEDHCNRMLELTKMGLQNNDSLKNIRSVLESEPFLGEAHQSELEKAHATPVEAGVAKDRRLSGVKILPSERNKNDWPQGDYVNQCCECKETFLGQKRSCACRACVEKKGQEHFTQPPVDAGGDDAAVVAIFHAWVNDTGTEIEGMRAILAAIRAGKVPGVYCWKHDFHDQWKAAEAKLDHLRARLADAERRADEMEGKAGEWIAVDVHKQRLAAAVSAVSLVAKDREAECSPLRARVAELERHNADLAISVQHYGAERDRALADLGNERATLTVARECHARAEIALKADLAAERERRGKAEAKLAQSAAIDSHGNCGLSADGNGCNTMAELAAARAEVAALKARNDAFTRVLHAARDTCGALVMPRMESQDDCGLRELRDAVSAAGVDCE